MQLALCHHCVQDGHLSKIIRQEGQVMSCAVCGNTRRRAITVHRLGQILEPIMREHFELGPQVRKFSDDDKDRWEQDGEQLSDVIQEVLGQYFDFEDDIVDAVIDADEYWPPDGGEPFWDACSLYVPRRVHAGSYFTEWNETLIELKHGRRFFSPAARTLFEKLFLGIESLHSRKDGRNLPVVRVLKKGTSIYRARLCDSQELLKKMLSNPMQEIGPPPAKNASSGRMNAEGVVVLYAARDQQTCIAEMRPALGSDVSIIELKTTRSVRVVDFSRLDEAWTTKDLSYFQPDFTDQIERRAFLRRLHSLISQPITPGNEADYLITQTMAEYLAHVHEIPFDGILFSSVQRAGGMNIVLFPQKGMHIDQPIDPFRVKYVENSVQFFSTTAIRYSHRSLNVALYNDGEVWIGKNFDSDEEY